MFEYNVYNLEVAFKTLDFLKKLIQSDGILSSIQFAFTALLTLLIPLIIFAFEERRELKNSPKYNNLKKVTQNLIDSKLDIQRKLYLIVSAGIVIIFWNNNGDQNIWQINLIIFIVLGFLFGFLVKELKDIINFLNKSLDESIADHIKDSTASPETKRGWFDEYFSKRPEENQKQTKEELNLSQKIHVTMLEMFYLEVDRNLEIKPSLASDFLKIFENNIDILIGTDFYNITSRIYNRDKSILQKILEWHLKSWKFEIKKKNNLSDYLAGDYSKIKRDLSELIEKLEIIALKYHYFYDFIEILKPFLEENYNQKIKLHPQDGNWVNEYYYKIPIWMTFFENIHESKIPQNYSFQPIYEDFPEKWKISFSVEKNEFESSISEKWWYMFKIWFRARIQRQSFGLKDENFDTQIEMLFGILFPKINYYYWSIILWYGAIFNEKLRSGYRVSHMIKDDFPKWFVIDVDDGYDAQKYSQDNKQDLTIQLATTLFKDIFTKNLPEDLAEINTLKTEFDSKAELTLEEKEQFQRLKIIENIWSKIDESLKFEIIWKEIDKNLKSDNKNLKTDLATETSLN